MNRFNKVGHVVDTENLKKSKRDIDRIVVHCSGTPRGRYNTAKDIHQWHKERGWAGIGYHYVLMPGGELQFGRNIDAIGAHAHNFNYGSIGICVIGGTNDKHIAKENYFTVDQMIFLESLLIKLHRIYPKAKIVGHRDLPHVNKACPCMNIKKKFGFIWNK